MGEYINIKDITALSLERYLVFNDWTRKYDFPNKNLMVFYYNDEILVVPASEKFKDFYTSLPKVVDLLAELYEKSVQDIIKEITSSYHDLLEFRIKSEFSENGKLPLDYAAECIEGIKDLILYSACAEQYKRPVCMKTTSNAKEVLNNFKLAQTEVGSFVINIDIQVMDEEEQYTLEGTDMNGGIEHRVVQRIGRAINQVDAIVNDGNLFEEIVANAYESGITANMCDAMLKLNPILPGAEIETKIRYASACGKSDTEVVKMRGSHFYTMNEISKRYRENDTQMPVEVVGYITSLNKKKMDEVHSDRVIHAVVDFNESMRTVIAELCDEDYRVACDAHRDGEKVFIRGVLDMSRRTYRFIKIDGFGIINE